MDVVVGGIFEPIVDLGDELLKQIAIFAVEEHCKKTGVTMRFHSLVSAGVRVDLSGKTYSLKMKVEILIGGIWAMKLVIFQVFVSYFGSFELKYYEEIEFGAN